MGQEVLLQMTDICKEFPGVKALDHVSLTVKKGTVHALMGENGAGKSTLMKCLFGIYSKDAGKIELEGKEVNFKNSREALNNGVAMVHQELNQALKRNVMDNIWLGRYPMTAGIMVNEHKMLEDTNKIFEELGIAVDPKRIMSTMPVSQRQMVEIAKAVSYNSKIIVFDEPTSSLTEEEVEHLFKIINMLRDRGCGIIYISHKMAEILRIADEVTVMRDGTWIATEPAEELTTDKIIRLMVGRELTNQFPPKTNKPGEVALEVEHLTARYSLLQDVSFKARKGEIVGLAGLDGSGRTETLENIFGVATRKNGLIKLDGKEVKNRNARESIKNGFALLTEERRATGIFGILNIHTGTVTYSNAGHNPPILMKKDGSISKVPPTGDMILGAINDACYHEKELKMSPGDNLFLYTDGVTEAMNTKHELYSEQRLLENCRTLAGKNPKEVVEKITETVGEFVVGAVQSDDITLLSISYKG